MSLNVSWLVGKVREVTWTVATRKVVEPVIDTTVGLIGYGLKRVFGPFPPDSTLSIKDAEAYGMTRELAKLTGKSMTEVVRESLREELKRERRRHPDPAALERIKEITRRCAALPVLDPRTDDEIVGYDEWGVPR